MERLKETKTDYSGVRRRAKIKRNKLRRRRLKPAITSKLKKTTR